MNVLRGVLFDKDGTLFDFSYTWESWAKAFLTRLSRDAEHAHQLGMSVGFDMVRGKFERDSLVIADTPDHIALALEPHLPGMSAIEVLDVLNLEAASAPQAEVTPLKPFLDRLSALGFALGLVTNDAERPAQAHLDAAGITECFDFIAGFDSGYGAKPGPGQLLAFAEKVNLAPHEVLMVGDSLHDLQAARRAGMPAVGVLTGLAEEADLSPYAEVVLPDISHLPTWLEGRKQMPQ